MPEDYQDLVLATYRKKCEERKLHLNLLKPTVVKLKKECIKKYDASDEAKDVFSDFFDKDKMDDISLILSKADPGDFRPLLNHINGATKRTDERNSELLAWLIDFQPRPSTTYYKSFDKDKASDIVEVIDTPDVKIDETLTAITGGNNDDNKNLENEKISKDERENKQDDRIEEVKEPKVKPTTPPIVVIPIKTGDVKINGGNTEPPPTIPKKPEYVPHFSPHYITISCIILLFVGTTSFAVWERRAITVRAAQSDEKFMYWDEDHYEPIKNEKQNVGSAIIPLNVQTLTHQRKINLPDTLTSYSIGKVWYKGHGKDHEFFTASGPYPQDLQRVLKPLTNNILTKHTSNYRYMLTRLVWFICAAFFIGLCGFAVSKINKVDKSKEEKDPEINLAPEITHDVNGTESPQYIMPA
ncbi:hypothetical protein SAMN05421827_103127 [Pedobacter terrae]|uniref:Uncharacterized protein n=1 Tax=Pedobacter terrae TaxID=405671 RepID=A0A1G7RAN6_9SPHI|nr:hypothetical protein [Pedobacter terrae]SDG07070.1 hypothetical protein SAMN05421827_103127 [Pedobacter terrae]